MTLSSRSNVNVKGKQEKLARRVDAESEMSRLQKQVSTILSLELNKTTKLDDKSASAEEEQRVPCLADYHKDEVGHRTRERFCSQCSSRVKLLEEQKRGLSLKLMESEKNVERLVRVLSNLKDILRYSSRTFFTLFNQFKLSFVFFYTFHLQFVILIFHHFNGFFVLLGL